MGSRKNIKQEKSKGSRKIFNTVEGIYGRGGYLGKERKFKECGRIDKRVRTGGSSSETRSRGGGRIQKNGVTREIHGKVVIRME